MKTVIHHLVEVTSTNDEARRMAEAGAPEGTVVWADHQSEGRGRHGRAWFSSPGEDVLLSVVLRPRALPDRLGIVTMMGAVAVAESILAASGLESRIKWPNDVLIGGRKVSGMLLESAQDGRLGTPPRFVVLGIGINVNQRSFPPDLEHTSTSLVIESGRRVSRHDLVGVVTSLLEAWYGSFMQDSGLSVRSRYLELLDGLGKPATLHVQGAAGSVQGRLVGVAEGGAVELELSDGRRELFYAGDVTTQPSGA